MRLHCSWIRSALQRASGAALSGVVVLAGCAGAVPLDELSPGEEVEVRLDANARTAVPGHRLKFYVDVWNTTERTLDLTAVSVELTVSPAGDPETVALRKDWDYRWNRPVELPPRRKLTLPVVPEVREAVMDFRRAGLARPSETVTISELPIQSLAPGPYEVRAILNGRFASGPYALAVHRPGLRSSARRGPENAAASGR